MPEKQRILSLIWMLTCFFIMLAMLKLEDIINLEVSITTTLFGLVILILVTPLFWVIIKETEKKKEELGSYPSFFTMITDTNFSKYSSIGMIFLVIFFCLVFLAIKETSISNALMWPAFISLFTSLIFMICGMFFGADSR